MDPAGSNDKWRIGNPARPFHGTEWMPAPNFLSVTVEVLSEFLMALTKAFLVRRPTAESCGASLSTCTGEYQSPDKRE